jgi:hypothetical protein
MPKILAICLVVYLVSISSISFTLATILTGLLTVQLKSTHLSSLLNQQITDKKDIPFCPNTEKISSKIYTLCQGDNDS